MKKAGDDESGGSDGEDDYQDSDEDPDYVAKAKKVKPGQTFLCLFFVKII